MTKQYSSNLYNVRKAIGILKSAGILYSVPKFGVYVSKESAPTLHNIQESVVASRDMVVTYSTQSTLDLQRKLWGAIAADFSQVSPFSDMQTVYFREADNNSGTDLIEYGTLSLSYLEQKNFINIKHYFPHAIGHVDLMLDSYGVPFYYVTPVMMYNLDMLKKLGFEAPSYRNYQEQVQYLEAVMAKVAVTPGLCYSGTSQQEYIRLGNHLYDMLTCIKDGSLGMEGFVAKYHDVVVSLTDYWRRYPTSYPKHAVKSLQDFTEGRTPFFFGLTADYTHLLGTKMSFDMGAAMMYAVDNTFPRILVALTIHSKTRSLIECFRLARLFQSEDNQRRVAQLGGVPLDMKPENLPFSLVIPQAQAARPLYFSNVEDHYVCCNIINNEIYNITLFNKDVDEAIRDAYMVSKSYLTMCGDAVQKA